MINVNNFFIELVEREIHCYLQVMLFLFMALFMIDLDERIIKHDSELQFTLKSVFKKLDILSIVSTQNIIFCKKIL